MILAGCQTDGDGLSPLAEPPQVSNMTQIGERLKDLPPPARVVDVAVYAFPDLTGQYKESDTTTEYSRAVTQGANAFLIDALQIAGNGKWFSVVERSGLQNLLQERQIISTTNQQYSPGAQNLPPLRFAGILIEGGIVGYDTNTMTGGAGARFLGIGGDAKYRRDTITVSLRAVSVSNGQVLQSITTSKTIYSVGLQAGTFKYVALNELLEIESGVTRNEPVTVGVREAIEVAVMGLVVDGARKGVWDFADRKAGRKVIAEFIAREGYRSPLQEEQVASAGSVRIAQPVGARVASAPASAPLQDNAGTDSTNEASTRRLPVTVTPNTRFGPNNPPPA